MRKQIAEKKLAHAAAQFRRAENVDQFGGGFADLMNLADFLAEIADDLGGIVEPRVHRGARLLEVLGDSLAELVEPLLQPVELLLEHEQRLIGRLRCIPVTHHNRDQRPDRDKRE